MAGEKRGRKKRMKWQKRNKDSGRRMEREKGRCLCFCFEIWGGGRRSIEGSELNRQADEAEL